MAKRRQRRAKAKQPGRVKTPEASKARAERRNLLMVFRDAHKYGQQALHDRNLKRFGEAIAMERSIIGEQRKAADEQRSVIKEQRELIDAVLKAKPKRRKRRS